MLGYYSMACDASETIANKVNLIWGSDFCESIKASNWSINNGTNCVA